MSVSSAMPLGDIKQKVDGACDFYNHSKTFDVFYDQHEQQYPINTQTGLNQIERILAEVHWMFVSSHYFLFTIQFQLSSQSEWNLIMEFYGRNTKSAAAGRLQSEIW